ncbi:FGGY-family carbohydrate kinase [Pantoea sp. EA-12]|uniref:FGGY-family carbohydrate kinase n=1 Tax=Pantoea sp. EA-12 TaxID=3043303 RepID=UPI0024B5C749|nr:FGGY-family carbohydrate kinase [Pantoea sp. EA-12]MDI9222264.1 FGGY-family carbohydrate kinase [Pantoea sp. EA-12]
MSNEKYLIGVDVGSASARAGVFDRAGNLLGHAKQRITTFRAHGNVVEQSANEIWQAVSHCIREAIATAAIDPKAVAGIGFDATCSLVVIDDNGHPLPVSPQGDAERNIIVWMDHRATQQADAINATAHPVLDYVGGRISPEMEMPKLLWLKTHNPQTFQQAAHFFDLTDYLSWRATGDTARSSCTVTCKWNYLAHEQRWDADYFNAIGLPEFAQENFARIGQRIVEPGTPCGNGLTAQAAADFGLPVGTPIAAGLIDAHAGGVGTLGADGRPEEKLAYVFGTSSCTMTPTREAAFVPGVWGPYYSAMVPGLWLSEGGQSAAGAAIDRLLEMHPAAVIAQQAADAADLSLPVYLAEQARQNAASDSETVRLVEGLHIVPEFAGNRAPFGDPYARAVICGLGMDNDVASLISLYIAGLCSLGYGLRQIIEAQASKGIVTRSIVISGGAGQHPLVRQLLADSCQLPVQSTLCPEPVLLGSAILAATASGLYSDVTSAMQSMTTQENSWHPEPLVSALHHHRYDAFKLLQSTARNIRQQED